MSASNPVQNPPSTPRSRSKRFGIELLLLVGGVAVVGIVILIAGPSVLAWGERRAHEADATLLRDAVAVYRIAPPAVQPWPTLSGRIGLPREGDVAGYQCDATDPAEVCSWIDIELLVSTQVLAEADVISSADATLNVSAANAPSGHYGWFLDASGEVASTPPYSRDAGYP